MQKFKTLGDIIALAEFAHRNQVDKAGMPYIEHPKRVMAAVQAQGHMPYVQMAAVLHDVTEDTAFTATMLLDLGVPEAAVEIVMLCDRNYSAADFHTANQGRDTAYTVRYNRKFKYYIALGPDAEDEFYYARIKENPGAVAVKLADIHDNTQHWRLNYLPMETQERLIKKYAKAREMLGYPNVV
jgi:(p)ppGpp synthase/HD superfamily hydrolase